MSQQPDPPAENHPEPRSAEAEPVRTDNPRVDAVLDAVEQVEQRPVDEHVAVFEDAHRELRAALDDIDGPGEPGEPES
jgi:hypothetical protein